jgi:RNA polymerase sigma-70 factor (ECF subfamily)
MTRDVRLRPGNNVVVEEVAGHLRASTARPVGAARDVRRFEELWTRHYAAVHAHAARRVGGGADEVAAEVFLVAWRRLDELPGDALPWLLGVSRNVIGTAWRGDARRSRLRERLDATHEEPAATATDLDDPALQAALVRLGELDRELILLVYWDDLSVGRAGKALGLGAAAARTRLWRARRSLRTLLTEKGTP